MEFDDLAPRVADLEKLWRDLWLKYFVIPLPERGFYFGADYSKARRMLLHVDGVTPQAAQLLQAVRPILDMVRKDLHCLGNKDIRELEAWAAAQRLQEAKRFHEEALAVIQPWVDKMGGVYETDTPRGAPTIHVGLAEYMADAGLPRPGNSGIPVFPCVGADGA